MRRIFISDEENNNHTLHITFSPPDSRKDCQSCRYLLVGIMWRPLRVVLIGGGTQRLGD